MTSVI